MSSHERDGGADPALQRLRRNAPRQARSTTSPSQWQARQPVTTAAADAPVRRARCESSLAAERLFALHGIDGVSLRQIAAEAGSANNSAVHYHFGSKTGLIAAIFRTGSPSSSASAACSRPAATPTTSDRGSRRTTCRCSTLAEAPDNHYVSFVEQLQRRWTSAGASATSTATLPDLPSEGQHSIEDFRHDLERLLPHLDEPLRRIRIATAMSTSLYAAADRERAVAGDVERPPFELFVSALLDGIVGFLEAPVSDATAKWLGRAGDVATHRHHVL